MSAYLESVIRAAPEPAAGQPAVPSQHSQDIASEALTSSLISSAQDIMARAEAEGRDPDGELREVVGRVVLRGVVNGFQMATDVQEGRDREQARPEGKRARRDPQ